MPEPSKDFQAAMYAALIADAELAGLVGDRIYDQVPVADGQHEPTFPYVRIGTDQLIDDGDSCGDGWQVFSQVDVFSRDAGKVEVKEIASAVRRVLSTALSVPGFVTLEGLHVQTTFGDDPDMKTSRAICRFRYLIDPAA